MSNRKSARVKAGLAGVILWLVGCDAGQEKKTVTVGTASVTEIALPEILRTVAAVNPDAIQLRTVVNDVETTLDRGEDDIWSGVVNVPANQRSVISVEWGMEYGTSGYVKLAELRREQFVGADATNVYFASEFDTEFVDDGNEDTEDFFAGRYNTNFDDDFDTRTNLVEVLENRSPVSNLDVFINEEGAFVTGGIGLESSGVCGNKIPIAIVTRKPQIEGDGADTPAADHEAWWCAKLKSELTNADGNLVSVANIEVTVNVIDNSVMADIGSIAFHDDSVEIFIDGNNNKGGEYDGQNDYQFIFVPVGDGVVNMPNGPARHAGNPDGLPINLSGKFTLTSVGYQLVATIPLAELNINRSSPFGINVEVNDDDDGGDRDYKYSWVGSEGLDLTFRNTRFFGTAQVP